MTIFPKQHRDLKSVRIRQTVRLQQQKTVRKTCMRSSSIRRFFTHRKERKCYRISFTMCAVAVATGRWILLWSIPFRKSAKSRKRQGALCSSGGVDSSVAAVLLSKAVGDQLTCVFVDHGLPVKMKATRSRKCLDQTAIIT